jgi:hypothetical protein
MIQDYNGHDWDRRERRSAGGSNGGLNTRAGMSTSAKRERSPGAGLPAEDEVVPDRGRGDAGAGDRSV